jgi:hypothetical protein
MSFWLTLSAIFPVHAAEKADGKQLDEIAERGAHVMPFDLEKTTHIFTQTPNGGVQQVIAKNKSDTGQINLIRAHLSEVYSEFKQGNFSNPEKIHGKNMPGLAELKAAQSGQVKFEYEELSDGAQITYFTEVEKLKHAIHQWFDAQLSDHARHAVPGHSHHPMHHQ